MMVKIRTPRPHYFKHGVIKYSIKTERLHYQLGVWSDDGLNYIFNQKILVPNEDFVSKVENCTTLDQIKSQIFSTVSKN